MRMLRSCVFLFVVLLLMVGVGSASTLEVTPLSNGIGYSDALKCDSSSSGTCSPFDLSNYLYYQNIAQFNLLSSSDRNYISDLSSTTNFYPTGYTSAIDTYVYVNFTVLDVQSVSQIDIYTYTKSTHSTEYYMYGLYDYSVGGRWNALTSGSGTTFASHDFSISGADIAKYSQLSSGILTFSVAGWTVGTRSALFYPHFKAIITYEMKPPPKYTPNDPSSLTHTNGSGYVNFSWTAPVGGNITDGYTVLVNSVYINISNPSTTYINLSGSGHGYQNITVWAYNQTNGGSNSVGSLSDNVQMDNTLPEITASNSYTYEYDTAINLLIAASDPDSDSITWDSNATEGTLNPTTGYFTWTPASGDVGTYVWNFNVTDSYGGVTSKDITFNIVNPITYLQVIPSSTVRVIDSNVYNTASASWVASGHTITMPNITGTVNVSVAFGSLMPDFTSYVRIDDEHGNVLCTDSTTNNYYVTITCEVDGTWTSNDVWRVYHYNADSEDVYTKDFALRYDYDPEYFSLINAINRTGDSGIIYNRDTQQWQLAPNYPISQSWWRLDKSTVVGISAYDQNSTTNTTLYINTGDTVVSGKYGNAVSFDGTQRLNAGNIAAYNITGKTFSIGMWIKQPFSSSGTQEYYVSKSFDTGDLSGMRWYGYGNYNYSWFRFYNNAGSIMSINGVANITDNQWHYISVVGDGTNAQLYHNCVADGSSAAIPDTLFNTNAPFNIGALNSSSGYLRDATIDEVRFDNGVAWNTSTCQAYMNNTMVTSGNITTNISYNSDKVISAVLWGGSNQTNSNVSIYVNQSEFNTTWSESLWKSLALNNIIYESTPSYPNYQVRLQLNGSGTATPFISNVSTFTTLYNTLIGYNKITTYINNKTFSITITQGENLSDKINSTLFSYNDGSGFVNDSWNNISSSGTIIVTTTKSIYNPNYKWKYYLNKSGVISETNTFTATYMNIDGVSVFFPFNVSGNVSYSVSDCLGLMNCVSLDSDSLSSVKIANNGFNLTNPNGSEYYLSDNVNLIKTSLATYELDKNNDGLNDSVFYSTRLAYSGINQTINQTFYFSPDNLTLIAEMNSSGLVSGFSMGSTEDTVSPTCNIVGKNIYAVPETFGVMKIDSIYLSAFLDWEESNATTLTPIGNLGMLDFSSVSCSNQGGNKYNYFSGSTYSKTSAGVYRINGHERVKIRASTALSDLLNFLPDYSGKVQLGKDDLAGKVIFDSWRNEFSEKRTGIKKMRGYGIDNVVYIEHVYQKSGYDKHLPDILPPNNAWGGTSGMLNLSNEALISGYLFGLHRDVNIMSDETPPISDWNQTYISINSTGGDIVYQDIPGGELYKVVNGRGRLNLTKKYVPLLGQLGANVGFEDVMWVSGLFDNDLNDSESMSSTLKYKTQKNREAIAFAENYYQNPHFGEGFWYGGYLGAGYITNIGTIQGNKADLNKLIPDIYLNNLKQVQTDTGGFPKVFFDGSYGITYDMYTADTMEQWNEPTPWRLTYDQYRNMRTTLIGYGKIGFIYQTPKHLLMFDQVLNDYFLMSGTSSQYIGANATLIEYPTTESGSTYETLEAALLNSNPFTQLRITYDNGLIIYINRATTDWSVTVNSITYSLPQYGWIAYRSSNNFLAYYAKPSGQDTTEYIRTSDYTYENVIKGHDAVSYFAFEEGGSNRTEDQVNTQNRISLNLTEEAWTTGKEGNAILYNENYSGLTINNSISLNAIDNTVGIGFWFNWQNASTDNNFHPLVQRGWDGSAGGYAFLINQGILMFAATNSTSAQTQARYNTVLTNNTWYHAFGEVNSTHVNLYINGTLVSSMLKYGSGFVTSNGNIYVGTYLPSNQKFTGIIDELRVYPTGFNSSDISLIYQSKYDGFLRYNTSNSQGFYNYNNNATSYYSINSGSKSAWDMNNHTVICHEPCNGNITEVSANSGFNYKNITKATSKINITNTSYSVLSDSGVVIDSFIPIYLTNTSSTITITSEIEPSLTTNVIVDGDKTSQKWIYKNSSSNWQSITPTYSNGKSTFSITTLSEGTNEITVSPDITVYSPTGIYTQSPISINISSSQQINNCSATFDGIVQFDLSNSSGYWVGYITSGLSLGLQTIVISCTDTDMSSNSVNSSFLYSPSYDNIVYHSDRKSYILKPVVSDYWGHWKLDGSNVTTYYDMNQTNPHHLTFTGASSTPSILGMFGNGLNLNGDSDRLYISSSSDLDINGSFTVAAWVTAASSVGNEQNIISRKPSWEYNDGFQLYIEENGNPALRAYNSITSYTATKSVDVTGGAWHFIVGQFNGTHITVYSDDMETGTSTAFSGSYSNPSSQELDIGSVTSGLDLLFGRIDEVYLYKKELNSSERISIKANSFVSSGNYTSGIYQTAEDFGLHEIAFNGSLENNSQIDLYANLSSDGTLWTGLNLIKEDAVSDELYNVNNRSEYCILTALLTGNGTTTPEFNYFNVTEIDLLYPASITNNQTTTGNFWINNTWTNPDDVDFSHVTFKYANGTLLQNVSAPTSHLNVTYSSHYQQNISAQTVDTSGNINSTLVWFNATISNNAPILTPIGDIEVTEGDTIDFTMSTTDADGDTITNSSNATKGTFTEATGNFNWITEIGDAGTYIWNFTADDGYGGTDVEVITVTVNAYVPPAPAITWYNNTYTNDTNTAFTVPVGSNIIFHVLANQTITSWNWSKT